MKINNLNIDTSDMPNAQTMRLLTVQGDVGARFQLVILQNPSNSSTHTLYYDFNNKTFESGYNDSSNVLNTSLAGAVYSNNINFPEGGGDYVIKLIAVNGTTILGSSSNIITRNITKASENFTITFTPGTLAANAANYATLPTSTSAGAVGSNGVVNFDWDVTNSTTDAKSHGFIVEGSLVLNESFWYTETTEAVKDNPAGDGEDTAEIEVDSLTGLFIGMELKYHKGTTAPTNKAGSACGTTRINGIDTVNKKISFSTSTGNKIAFEDGETMTLRSYGAGEIEKSTGVSLSFDSQNMGFQHLTSTLRDDSDGDYTTSTTVRLGATRGIAGGAHVTYTGQGVDNSSTNTVTSVTPDPDGTDGDGAMVVTLTQVLKRGTVLTFSGSHEIINFSGIISINGYPSANTTVYLDLEKIITLGAAS